MNTIDKIIIHHSLTDDDELLKDFDAIKKYHTQTKGWRDIGYHYIIEKVHGSYVTIKGRPETMSGAHTIGQNSSSIGICVVGNFDKYAPDASVRDELDKLIQDIFSRHGKLKVYGHCHFALKSCPGKFFPLKEVIDRAEQKQHWAEKHFESLREKGVEIHEKRFDDNMTRGEVFALLDRIAH